MSRLIVQHPQLQAGVIEAISGELGDTAQRHAGIDTGGNSSGDSAPHRLLARWDIAETSPPVDRKLAARIAEKYQVDAAWQPRPTPLADFRLIAFDMDSTLITIECIDEMADYFGKKPAVAAITEAAMRGEISDYNDSLRRRTALLTGMPAAVMEQLYEERLRLSPGVERLIERARQAGLKVLLVSGGFTYFANRLKDRLRLDFARANELQLAQGRLTGSLVGEIINADVKKRIVQETCAAIGCAASQAIVVGDGANDLQMMSIAGASIAYRAKPVVRAQAMYALNYCGLDAAINFFE